MFCHNTAYRRRMDQLRLEQRRIQGVRGEWGNGLETCHRIAERVFPQLQFHGWHRLRLAFPHHSKRQVVILVGTSRAIHVVGPPDAICNLLQLRIAQSGNKRRALWNQSDIQRIHKGSPNQLTAQQKAGVRSCLLFYFSGNRLLSFLSTTANAVTTIRPVSTHDIG